MVSSIKRALLMLLSVTAVVEAQGPPFIKDNPRQHERYFFEERAYPFDRIPENALRRARKQMEAQFGIRRGLMSAQAVGNGWTAVGPNTVSINIASSGRLTAIAVHPTQPNIIFVGGAQGGVWRTTNGGANWTPVTDDQCSLAMGSLAIDQVNPNIIYAGTGELHNSGDSYYGCGVLRSTDGGTTWQQLGASVFDVTTPGAGFSGGTYISKIVIDRTTSGTDNATTVFAATRIGLFKSTNSGVDWTLLSNGIPSGSGAIFSDMVADTTRPGTFYAALGNSSTATGNAANGVYKTTDGGANWVKQPSGPSGTSIGRINLAISQSNPDILFAAAEQYLGTNDGQLAGIWKTSDGGANWATVAAQGASCNSQCWYDQHIAVHPLGPDTVYYGGFLLYKSTNGGVNFSQIQGNIHVDQHAFAFDPLDPRIIYAGNDGGIYKSVNGGGSWTTLNTDIAIHQFYAGISLHPTDPNKMMGGSQDNGTNEYNGSLNWLAVIGGDGGATAIDHITGNTAWGETQWSPGSSNPGGPRRRDGSSGSAFTLKRNGINTDDRGMFIPTLYMDPVNPRVLYFGTFRLYRTRDNGESWTALTDPSTGTGGVIRAIAVARTDTNVIYISTNYGPGLIQVSPDGGTSWTAGTYPSQRLVTDIAIDPTNASVAYATVSGFGAGHVWKTINRGASWIDISSNLPDVPANSIVIQPGIEIDIGTDLGVFKSTNDGASWTPFTGLPNVAVFDLAFNPQTQLLVAATHGRGAFKFTVPQVLSLRGDVTADNIVSALDAQAVLSATVGLPLPPGWRKDGPSADADCNGQTPSAQDAQIILAYVVGLPVGGACVGKFQ